jgi:putative flavoprotein involved in K+ transport
VDVAVVGGGQAGLAIGYHLARAGVRFVVLEAGDSVGAAWRARWDSLVLFTPRRYDSLPGLPFPGDPDGYPARDEVAAYLEEYAERFALPVELGARVEAVRPVGGRFAVELADRTIDAGQVVVATGPFQTPRVPPIAGDLAPEVVQTHSTGYRRPGDLPPGTVVVVGGGNTGFQIAAELARTRDVHLSVGSRQLPLPQRLLGRDLFAWLERFGLMRKSVESRIGRRMRERETLIGSSPRRIRRLGVHVRPRLVAAWERTVEFEDGSELDVDAVVWATGFRPELGWIDAPVFDEDGRLRHRRGVTDVPGLLFLGLSWQHTRGSALLGWVKDDAEFVAERVLERVGEPARALTA